MAELPPLASRDFPQFFHALHARDPFPWQTRLSIQLQDGSWPATLDLPTGSGKTAVLDLAVFQLALEAGRATRKCPRRIVHVVDRRTIVDQAFLRARHIARMIEKAQDGVLAAVQARLSSYSRSGKPLAATMLRGGIARSDDWARFPDQPLVAVSTVDQVGSRLLFRGYGVSDAMKPVHAGLLGNDVLYLLDEVHLSEPFRQTLQAIGRRFRGWAAEILPSPFIVVEMSATPGRTNPETFGLGPDDHACEELARRLNASKPTTLSAVSDRGFVTEITKAVQPLAASPGSTTAVVVNRVASAREIHARLKKDLPAADIELLTGRMRPLDRDRLERDLFPLLASGRTRDISRRPLIVVSTQCIEAGADFDFDALVTECASLDALRQRFGRLNRMGELPAAPGVVIARTDRLKDDPVYGTSASATWDWLNQRVAGNEPRSLDFGITAFEVPDDLEDYLAPQALAPVMMPAHLDAWVQTWPQPALDPDVGLWLHGPERETADVQIVWRADLIAELLDLVDLEAKPEDRVRDRAQVLAIVPVEAMPPASGEVMSVPYRAVRRWLDGQPEPDLHDVEGVRDENDDSPRSHARSGASRPRRALVWAGERSKVIDGRELRPGQTLVVPASYGGIACGNWAPSSLDPVTDLAERAVFYHRGRATLRLHPAVFESWFRGEATGERPPVPVDLDSNPDAAGDRQLFIDWLASTRLPDDLHPIVEELRAQVRDLRIERLEGFAFDSRSDGESGPSTRFETPPYLLVSARRRISFPAGSAPGDAATAEVTTEDDRASFTGQEVTLASHLDGVAGFAEDFARRVGLPPDIVADVGLAARWHDIGKADPRFQRLLHGGSEYRTLVAPALLAKSSRPMNDPRARERAYERSDYPRGARHEMMSVALMSGLDAELRNQAHDWDLVLHLVGSHHGRGRPLAPCVTDLDPLTVKLSHQGHVLSAASTHGLERLDSGVGDRFWRLVRRYGWWGLAWLETILRLGDHRRSEAEQSAEVVT